MTPVLDYSLRQLSYLVAVSDAGPMTAAAERCYVTQAAPTYRVVVARTRSSQKSRRHRAAADVVGRVARMAATFQQPA